MSAQATEQNSVRKLTGPSFLWALLLALTTLFCPPAINAAPTSASDATFKTFEENIYPLLQRGGDDSCLSCHDSDDTADLVFVGNAEDDYKLLLDGNYFDAEALDGLLARVASTNHKKRMPKGKRAKPWSPQEIQILNAFLDHIADLGGGNGSDEEFPSSLLSPFKGKTAKAHDNQFLTYRQLRGKIKTIFDDDWNRGDKDQFVANLALFGGADFKERFNESTEPSSSFMTALKMMARDVSAQAFTRKTGPFAGRPDTLPSPERMTRPDSAYSNEIARLYQAILFRSPTSTETDSAFKLIKGVYGARIEIESSDFELAFELTVRDPATELSESRVIRIPVSGAPLDIYQELVDQSVGTEVQFDKAKAAGHLLKEPFHFVPGNNEQCLDDDRGSRLILFLAGIMDLHLIEGIGVPVVLLFASRAIAKEALSLVLVVVVHLRAFAVVGFKSTGIELGPLVKALSVIGVDEEGLELVALGHRVYRDEVDGSGSHPAVGVGVVDLDEVVDAEEE